METLQYCIVQLKACSYLPVNGHNELILSTSKSADLLNVRMLVVLTVDEQDQSPVASLNPPVIVNTDTNLNYFKLVRENISN